MQKRLTLSWLSALLLLVVFAPSLAPQLTYGQTWERHTIDDTSRGADGVRIADINNDGRMDLVCGWEEGGVIRVYLQPVHVEARRKPWPQVTVGKVKSPEDAVFVDLDHDGRWDVVSSTEGKSRTLFVHWGPPVSQLLDAEQWTTAAIPCAHEKEMWMFAMPMELDGQPGDELIVGSKGQQASISILTGPNASTGNRRDLTQYKMQKLYAAGWIMSLVAADLDHDGDQDILASDRKGAHRGVLWLENPGTKSVREGAAWNVHRIAGDKHEVMFLDYGSLEKDKPPVIVTATRNQSILVSRRPRDPKQRWDTHTIPNPFDTPHGKAVAIADINGDGKMDLIHTVNNGGKRQYRGATWLEAAGDGWRTHDISGERGVKFDLIQRMDVDEDGDVDFLSCEERDNLGLFWYENKASR